MVDLLAEAGVDGATVLEIGGGVGEIEIELLERGAASATGLELSPAYDADAARLLAEKGLGRAVRRRLLDLAAEPDAVEPADVVVLHRVVCCYPDYARLLSAAAGDARRQLVFSHPPRNVVSPHDHRRAEPGVPAERQRVPNVYPSARRRCSPCWPSRAWRCGRPAAAPSGGSSR